MNNEKAKVARLSVISNSSLIITKLIIGIVTGSVSIISEAIHSTMDLLAAIIAFFSVKISDLPPDEKHQYGHGKYENVSGVIEALLIFAASVWIIYEAIKKITVDEPVESIGLGSLVMLFSAVVNFFISRKLYKVAKKTDSIALEADALHLKADVFTSLGVAAGLGLIWITGLQILDPIIAILVALFILYESYQLLRKAYTPLLDKAMDESEIQIIQNEFQRHQLDIHNLKTRLAGSYKFAEVHLELPGTISLDQAHKICDHIEKHLKERIPRLEITIHVEPKDANNKDL